MARARDLVVRPIGHATADALVRRLHYSGRVVKGSQLHLGVFLDGRLEGAMQFGPPMDRRAVLGLVAGTAWYGMIELNRMAFGEALPRNSESRALGVAFRLIRRHYPQIGWVLSFADGAQCGDGTIYRAAGFVLTGIKPNRAILELPDGTTVAKMTVTANLTDPRAADVRRRLRDATGGAELDGSASVTGLLEAGARWLPGFQLRYIRFLDPAARARLTVPVLPFEEIETRGAAMYRGVPRAKQAMAGPPVQRQGGTDPHAPDQGDAGDGEGQEGGKAEG